ncbi:hypothetical protein FXB40_05655 [Bradyrhizobium rifense]|uniref:Cytochrome c domain-containing protein n=1 Tax=Bradyrhizobium rifense TaxID=515499 RepID=A0A5D3KY25_9BRAD|nr:hypothetical protein [Bradyrhizobium rifense]TYL98427.1 hypothetical protein FXB40_05655 [Bradyrhizobium rifense]
MICFSKKFLTSVFNVTTAIAAAATLALPAVAHAQATPPYLASFPGFAPALTPDMPGDVDIALKQRLERAQEFSKVQREFDLNAWQMFLALNWPTNDQGQSAPRIEDTGFGPPHWTLWHDSSSIFQAKGAVPESCGKPPQQRQFVLSRNLAAPVSAGLPAFRGPNEASVASRSTRFLGVISAVGELNVSKLGGDIQQAFTGPLIDQNGNFVFYEIMIDPNEVNYLCDNKLYNINGQVAFSTSGGKVDMPTGHPQQNWSGSFELKLAWKVIGGTGDHKDDPSRFFTQRAEIIDQGDDGKPVKKTVEVGLVGMHIGHKSETSPQWIWATFEQIDNLDVDQVAHPNLHPSFFDPGCPLCTVNVQPQTDPNTRLYPRTPVQASRTIPIPADKVALNREAQAVLAKLGSVWQYYQLVDTQWPTAPSSKPSAWNSGLSQAVSNKPGGQPTPVFLTNITMETYFQSGNQPACNQEENVPSTVTCPPDYPSVPPGGAIAAYTPDPPIWTTPLNNGGAAKPGISTQIMATESCMGCHSSAGIVTAYDPQTGAKKTAGQLSADFSWLLSKKAQFAP